MYNRTIKAHNEFHLPADFVEWQPTCHHLANLPHTIDRFLKSKQPDKLLYIWWHSWEFARDNNWTTIDKFAREIAKPGHELWLATNGDIFEYVAAWGGLWCSQALMYVRNPHAVDVYLKPNASTVRIPSRNQLEDLCQHLVKRMIAPKN